MSGFLYSLISFPFNSKSVTNLPSTCFSTLILDTSSIIGGQILNTYEIDNYPGFPGATGAELAEAMRTHCEKLGVEFAK